MQGFARAAQADLRSVSGGLRASQFPGQLVVPFHERFEFQCGESPFAHHDAAVDHGKGGLRAGTQQQGCPPGSCTAPPAKAQRAQIKKGQICAHARGEVANICCGPTLLAPPRVATDSASRGVISDGPRSQPKKAATAGRRHRCEPPAVAGRAPPVPAASPGGLRSPSGLRHCWRSRPHPDPTGTPALIILPDGGNARWTGACCCTGSAPRPCGWPQTG
jgi:hypothetical protein